MAGFEEVENPYLLDAIPENIMSSMQCVGTFLRQMLDSTAGAKCIASQIMLHIPPIWRNPAHKSHINFPQKENGGKSGEINVQLSPRQRGFVGETW